MTTKIASGFTAWIIILTCFTSGTLAWLMRLGRTCSALNASLYFDADEIRGAQLLAKKAVPKNPMTLGQIIRLVAFLGGFLARKSDSEPGAKTLGIGMQ